MCEPVEATPPPPLGRRRFLAGAATLGLVPTMARAGAALAAQPAQPAPGLAVWRRAAWAEDLVPTGPIADDELRFLIVHHSATSNTYAPGDVAGVLRGIYRFHTGPERGWPDVCYHFFIDRYGGVWEGRAGSLDRAVTADATGGNQGFAQLACLLGDFSTAAPPAPMTDALVALLAWSAERWAIDTTPGASVTFTSRGSNRWPPGATVTTSTIAGHRDMSATSCPGDAGYALVRGELAARVDDARGPRVMGDAVRRPGEAVHWWQALVADVVRAVLHP